MVPPVQRDNGAFTSQRTRPRAATQGLGPGFVRDFGGRTPLLFSGADIVPQLGFSAGSLGSQTGTL